MLDSVTDLTIFTRVAAAGSLTGAGRALGLSPAVVSKRLARLEGDLGARLFHRTTRRLSLTEEGQGFLERCIRILADIEEAEAAVTNRNVEPRGTLKATASASFANRFIVPVISEFLTRYPQVRMNLTLTDSLQDLIEDGYDVAIRIARLSDSTLIARKLAPNHRVVCASPEYLERHGTPERPADLASHNCLVLGDRHVWRFTGPDGPESHRVAGNLETNNGDLLRRAALEGLGIARKSSWDVAEDIQSGALQTILTGYPVMDEDSIYAVYPSARHLSAKVRAFVDFLAGRFAAEPRLSDPQSNGN